MKMSYTQQNIPLWFLFFVLISILHISGCSGSPDAERSVQDFGKNWKFHLGDTEGAYEPMFDDNEWRQLDVPHDWSIEGEFSAEHPAGPQGGGLPGGVGWYRKTFTTPEAIRDKSIFINFDGVYQNSEIWINGTYLGKRPYGYISFRYELTDHLYFGNEENVIAVRVDNSLQPNSRWYSGSGIYRNVWLVTTGKTHVDHWGTFVTTPEITDEYARVIIETTVMNNDVERNVTLETIVYDPRGRSIARVSDNKIINAGTSETFLQELSVENPDLWSIDDPNLYMVLSRVIADGTVSDMYETEFGIRYFHFDRYKGFFLNGEPIKILGVNLHHDLGALGAAVNSRAIERQLEIMRAMGANAIRTAHNPPAPELLKLTDRMGFIVMNEAFDSWKLMKTEYARYDYHLHWDEWHERDLRDFIKRDRNHPSVIMWSIGNEVREQFDDDKILGMTITRELADIVRSLDTTRVITAGNNNPHPDNPVFAPGALDVLGFNYYIGYYPDFLERFPGGKFIATETTAPLALRGHYKMPSDLHRIWPPRDDYAGPAPDYQNQTASAYDNSYAAFGSPHQMVWKIIRDHDFLSGMFIWSGIDYLGEPTPYGLPARSSYFGIVDLAGFPKDPYYMYKSEWTDEPVLHLFPHWNWEGATAPEGGDTIDVWAYSNSPEVELFLNGVSLGVQRKTGMVDREVKWTRVRRGHGVVPDREVEDIHFIWRVAYEPGTVRAVARDAQGNEMLVCEMKTAGVAYRIELEADRSVIDADGNDLSFITVRVLDENGVLVPRADNLIHFNMEGSGFIAGVDNGDPRSYEPFKAEYRKAFNGTCLVIIQSNGNRGTITIDASSEGLEGDTVTIRAR
jgi:beta-galactosidase